MTPKELLQREIEILKQFPKSELPDVIERKGGELRTILTEHEEMSDREVMECLTRDYAEL